MLLPLGTKRIIEIEVTSDDKDKLAIFYTALYHTMMQPNIAQDLDGKYRGRDNQIHVAEGFDYYTVFRCGTRLEAHPLYTLIDKNEQRITSIPSLNNTNKVVDYRFGNYV